MINRHTHSMAPGGDTVQLESTAEYLRMLGIDVDVVLGTESVDYSRYDLLHFFNIIRPSYILYHIAKSNKPFVVSPIYVNYQEYEYSIPKLHIRLMNHFLSTDMREYLKIIARKLINGESIGSKAYLLRGHRSSIIHILRKTSLLLPNSTSEYLRLSKSYGVHTNYLPIPNAIDRRIFSDNVVPNPRYTNTVISVARIEGLKNQLNLIHAMNGLDLQLFIIGKPAPNHQAYYQQCLALAGRNVVFLQHQSQNELARIYKAARVHVLPSWFETTGLSSLEAAAMGCNIVITKKGDQEEYFKNLAYYCEPDDISSIRNAIVLAYHAKPNGSLKQYILDNYTWDKSATTTLHGYQSVLKR